MRSFRGIAWFFGLFSATFGVAVLGAAAPARAQQVGALEFGVLPDLQDCFEGKPGACAKAAIGLGDPAWEAWLLGEFSTPLQGNDRLLLAAFRCGQNDGPSCRILADDALERGDRFHAAMYAMDACSLGDSPACTVFSIIPDSSRSYDRLLLEPGVAAQDGWKDLASGAPVSGKTAAKMAAACDNEKGKLDDCVALANAWNGARERPQVRVEQETALRDRCAKKGGAACAFLRDIEQPDEPVDPRFGDADLLLRAICSQGRVENACFDRAGLLEMGRGTAFGSWGSRMDHGYACDGGRDGGCTRLTDTYDGGLAGYIDATCSAARSGTGGDPRSCTEAHTMRTFGVGLDKDERLAVELKKAACDLGDFRPCVRMGNEAWDSDRLASFRLFKKGCDGGDGISCGVIGRMRVKAEDGVPQDQDQGIRDMQRGCDLNGGNSCFELGYAYSQGDRGVAKDSERAAGLYAKSCSLGFMSGCSSLGVLYMDGRGVSRNPDHSIWLLRLACSGGFGSACRNLGNGYRDALLVSQPDYGRALWAYDAGCALEHEQSCEFAAAVRSEQGAVEAVEPPIGNRPATGLEARDSSLTMPAPTTGGAEPEPTPSARTRPPARLPGIRLADDIYFRGFGQVGSHRSWSASVQAHTLRGGFLVELGPLGVGLSADWTTDNTWRPKKGRTYRRYMAKLDVALAVGLGDRLILDIGGGGDAGAYRVGPGKDIKEVISGGVHGYLQFNIWFGEALLVGIRLEQQRLWQGNVNLPVDHVTTVTLVLGVRSES